MLTLLACLLCLARFRAWVDRGDPRCLNPAALPGKTSTQSANL